MSTRRSASSDSEIKSLRDWIEHYDIDDVHINQFRAVDSLNGVNGVELADKAIDAVVSKRRKNSNASR